MDFNKYYFTEAGGDGETFTDLVHKSLGGSILDPHVMELDDPVDTGFKDGSSDGDTLSGDGNSHSNNNNNIEDGSKSQDSVSNSRQKEIPVSNKFGGHGYMNTEGRSLYDNLVTKIVKSSDDSIVKISKSNQDNMSGYKVVFKPVGENPDLPEYNRTMYIFKNKSNAGDNNNDWTSIVFRGRDSFKDALKHFFPQLLRDKSSLHDLVHNVKWHQAQPSQISNPIKYANWKNRDIPVEDVDFTTEVIKDILSDNKNKSESFDEFYKYSMLIESLNEDSNNLIDKAIMNTFKGIGGGLAGLIKRPPIKKLGNPGQITKFFPDSSTYKVQRGVYDNVKTFCTNSLAEWVSVKETHGLIAQNFVKAKSVYVDKTYKVLIKTPNPKNEKKMEEFEAGFAKLIKSFDIDTKAYDFMIQDIRVYHTTNGGFVSIMMISLEEKDDEVSDNGENPINTQSEANDMTNPKGLEYQYFLGVDNKGKDFFLKTLNTDIKNFVQRYSTPDAAKKGIDAMNNRYKSIENDFMKGRRMIMKRSDIPNEEFNNILKSFNEYAKGKTKRDSTTEKNGMHIHQYVLNNGGKVMFINDGKGTKGRIIISLNAIKDFKSSKADDITKYNKVSLKDGK